MSWTVTCSLVIYQIWFEYQGQLSFSSELTMSPSMAVEYDHVAGRVIDKVEIPDQIAQGGP